MISQTGNSVSIICNIPSSSVSRDSEFTSHPSALISTTSLADYRGYPITSEDIRSLPNISEVDSMEGFSGNSSKSSMSYSKMMMVIWSFWSWDLQMQAEALVKLISGLCPVMARLLCAIVVQTLQETINPKIEKQERDANNPDFIRQLFNSHDIDFEKLFEYLALLKPSNVETQLVYISALPALFRNCIQQSTKIDQAKKLLQVVLIHPSFRHLRREFEHFKFQLLYSENDTRETASAPVPPPPVSSLQQNEGNRNKLLNKQLSQIEAILKDEKAEKRNLLGAEKQRSNGAYAKRPRNSNPWNNETVREEQTPTSNNSKPGMKDLYNWLKFLRLHKYFIQFERLTYEELLSLDETNFDMLVPGVTQGAKRKFLITIEGLRQRYRTLVSIDQTIETMSGDCLSSVMDQMRLMIFSPMKPPTEAQRRSPDDIPYKYFHVVRNILLRLLENRLGDEECIKRLRTLIYLTLRNEAFAPYTPALNAMKSRLYANEPLRNSMTATYLRTVSQQAGGFRNAWKTNPLLSEAPTSTLTRPLFIQIPDLTPQPSGLQAAEFERINHPQFESQPVDELPQTHEESNSDTLWRAVGSGVRSQSQLNSTSSSGFSSMRSQLDSTSSSGFSSMRSQLDSTSSSGFSSMRSQLDSTSSSGFSSMRSQLDSTSSSGFSSMRNQLDSTSSSGFSSMRSQLDSTSSSGFSSMHSHLNSTSSSGMRSQQNSTSSSFGVDSFRSPPADERTATTFGYVGRSYSAGAVDLRAGTGTGMGMGTGTGMGMHAAGNGATASAQQRTRGQSWSAGETYSDYKLFSDNDECDLFKEIWKVGLSDWKSYEFDDFGHFQLYE
ncbi:uncharacterized protein LOC111049322 [Nilaparvata lugens]|uniref:uncharacterized protein LOC111049322 n=1 Tax=Nilaparvata lugens TaxID=108931 RepID=UPI00193D962C|nr:uncharacterized protein LOC111049322 [Nilaparvata lugens]